jgi:drug/metabolite transporter (DMT)-like permease
LLLLVLVALLAIVEVEDIHTTAVFLFICLCVFIFVGVPICIILYFQTRRSAPPSTFETIAANIWLFLRRLICFIGATLFLFASVVSGFNLFSSGTEHPLLSRIGVALAFLLLAAFCIGVAILGKKRRTSPLREDIIQHRENKRRYRWRW